MKIVEKGTEFSDSEESVIEASKGAKTQVSKGKKIESEKFEASEL